MSTSLPKLAETGADGGATLERRGVGTRVSMRRMSWTLTRIEFELEIWLHEFVNSPPMRLLVHQLSVHSVDRGQLRKDYEHANRRNE
jgi:hypothetical protein